MQVYNGILSIRLAENDRDLKELSLLAESIWREHFTPILPEGQVDYMLEKFQSYDAMRRQCSQEIYSYYRIYMGEKLVGYFAVKPDGDRLFLSKLYLQKSCRKQGISRQAMNTICNIARSDGKKSVWLTVNRHNLDTIEVYKHFWFKITKEFATDIGGGYVMDDYFMELTV